MTSKTLTTSIIAAASLSISPTLLAKKTHSGRTTANTPEQQLAHFKVPDGYIIELVASEKDGIVNPIDLAFDDAGRLWTQTARMYPLDPASNIKWNELLRLMDNPEEQDENPEFKRIKDLYQGKTKGEDDVLILSNIYENETLSVKKFASGLTIPQSILPYKNGAYVMQGSELFYLEDTNNDGKADKRTPVITGFGITDTHTMGHCLVRGPGGWVHFSQGALNKGKITAVKSGESEQIDFSKIARFSTDGNKIQLVNAGLNNIWGFQLRDNGQWFMTEANDQSWSIVPAEPFTSYRGIGKQKLRPYQPLFPKLHKFRVGGTGISGLAFNDDQKGKFATDYKDVAFLANPITSKVNAVRIIRNPDGSVSAEHLKDFLTCDDDWFRPVHMDFGPDGNLYIADWYNKIVSHNEVETTHPDRDKSHGRIWRVRPKTAADRSVPNLYQVKNSDLIQHLKSPNAWERKATWQQIADRKAKELIPDLARLTVDTSASNSTRMYALWSLENLGHLDEALITKLANDVDGNIRRETLRSLTTFQPNPTFVAKLLASIKSEKNVMVRSQAIRTIEQLHSVNDDLINTLITFCHKPANGNTLGSSYEINFERALARRALEQHPDALRAYLATDLAKLQPVKNLIWAQQSFSKQTAKSFAQQWKTLSNKPLTKESLILITDLCADNQVKAIVKDYFSSPANIETIAQVALDNVAEAYTPAAGYPLAETAMKLLKSNNEGHQILGLKVIVAYRITHLSPLVAGLLEKAKSEALKTQIVTTLSYSPKAYAAHFRSIISDTSNSANLRISALSAYTQAKENAAIPTIKKFLSNNPGRKSTIVTALGSTTQGCNALLTLTEENILKSEDISSHIVSRLQQLYPLNPTTVKLHNKEKISKQANEEKATARILKLEKHIQKNPGNKDVGKAIFTPMCLSCHVVGQHGEGIGPALDGSSTRDLNHLLTAIIKPDEAAENAYILYRVTEVSGQISEGLKQKQDKRGTTIAFQGGITQFHPIRTIAKQTFVGSKSFMPNNFSGLPDSTIADLVAYIKTLK